ncbi:hypothetical protein ACTJJE_25080 [Mycolicibacterium sp. 22603]|uniref:hypothetical protein n=1 Tax=Mycolicibacterium sp. 22603 TaxID=3453950 RepID=UPI003F827D39
MREAPGIGWRADILTFGIPSSTADGDLPKIAASNDPGSPKPLIGSVGNKAYFLAVSTRGADTDWWLIGIDAGNGSALFDAVALSTGDRAPECRLNGPTRILCIDRSRDDEALVLDLTSGSVIYRGPSGLDSSAPRLSLKSAGNYAIATADGRGIYGIGDRAETTWFIPGSGTPQETSYDPVHPDRPVLSSQPDANPRVWNSTVYSLTDGKAISLSDQGNSEIRRLAFYPGGFVANMAESADQVSFFDETGRQVARVDGEVSGGGSLLRLPSIKVDDSDNVTIFSPAGDRLLTVPDLPRVRVGTTLFLMENGTQEFPEWRQYDLKTGAKGAACDFPMHRLLGTDGSVLVFETTNRQAGRLASARDMATCADLWVLPAEPDSLQRVWRIGSHLVQLSADGTELSSLVPRPQ